VVSATAATSACLLDAALGYSRRGWLVLPLHSGSNGRCSCGRANCQSPGKHPRTPNGLKDATTDPERITAWWKASPTANIGIRTGAESGIFVLDIDSREAAEALAAGGRALPEDSLIQETGRGWQVVFQHPGFKVKNSSGELADHIDVRGDGGYVVAAPSLHANGRVYTWKSGGKPGAAPGWLLDLLRSDRRKETAVPERLSPLTIPVAGDATRAYVLAALLDEHRKVRQAPIGSRNSVLNEAAFALARLARAGSEEAECEMALISAAIAAGLSAEEAQRTFRSGWQAGLKNPRTIPERRATSVCAVAAKPLAHPQAFALTDLGNAERLAAYHGHELRYEKASNCWYRWNGQRWSRDEALVVEALAARTARTIYEEAGREPDSARRAELSKHARATESRQRQQAMVASARHMLTIEPRQWDRDPWLLNALNGTIDLKTGELRPHRQEDLITMLAPVEYDPEAQSRLFLDFLEEVQPDAEIRDFLKRSLGYGLTGVQRQQHFWFCFGVGANGKGTLLNAVLALMGDYAKQAPPDLFIKDKSRHPTELAFLRGARLVVATETQEGSRMDESRVKQLTGGDLITARFIGGDFFTFAPTHKLWLQGNHKPRISGTDHAIWRRPLLTDFPVVVPQERQNPELPEKLIKEASGVLRWCVDGCLEWQRQGLAPPAGVLAATERYRLEMDVIGDFLEERCSVDAAGSAWARDLYTAYSSWCEESGERPLKQGDFGRRMKERGFPSERSTGGRARYSGLEIRE
jgi:putative DNA primase/helicase